MSVKGTKVQRSKQERLAVYAPVASREEKNSRGWAIWWFEKELLVMEEYDPMKTIEEYKFKIIPMWLCVGGVMSGGTTERI